MSRAIKKAPTAKLAPVALLLVAVAFAQLIVSHAFAAGQIERPAKLPPHARAAIVERLERMPRSPVIVKLNTEEVTAGQRHERRNGAFRTRMRQLIATRRARIMQRLGPRRAARSRHYRHLPFLALDVNEQELASLEAMPEVVSVEPDQLHAPSLDSSVPHIGGDGAWS